MNRDGVRYAAQVLRTHVTSSGARDHLAQVATVASLVYADRLSQPPIYPGDPNAFEEVSTRFSGQERAVTVSEDTSITVDSNCLCRWR